MPATPDTPRGASMNRPDTSPANVARVLRETARHIDPDYPVTQRQAYALADALDQQAAVSGPIMGALTQDEWAERIAVALKEWQYPVSTKLDPHDRMAFALTEAFPELAPTDD